MRALAAGKIAPNVIAEGDYRAQPRLRELLLQLRQRLAKLFAPLAQISELPLNHGFHKNAKTAVFQQNAALNLCHVVILIPKRATGSQFWAAPLPKNTRYHNVCWQD